MRVISRRIFEFFWGPADARAYALVRIGLSIGGLANLADLWPHRFELYASTGMISRDAVHAAMSGIRYLSVFDLVGSEEGTTAVFVAAGLALVALGLGVLPRASAALVFLWHLSSSHRAPPVLHGWDHILRAYSLLVVVSPMPDVWTLRGPRGRADDVPAYGLRLMQWQLAIIYLTTVWQKLPDPYWRNGQLLAYFSVSLFSRDPDTLFLIHHEWVSALATYASLAIEASIPWLLWFRQTRMLGLLAGFVLHFLVAVTARIAIFSTCVMIPYAAFLESADIDWLSALAGSRSIGELARILVAGRQTPGSASA
jgi:Vitamin K-dependent gamma-carboxylase